MNITDLTHERLDISIKAINQDPNVSASIKSAFQTFSQCLHDHKLAIDILEEELSHKASSTELHYGLSQKLTVGEFLKYFQKVQKIVEGVQCYQGKEEERLENLMNEKMMKIAEHMQFLIRETKKDHEEEMRKKIAENEKIIEKMKKEIKDIKEQRLFLSEQKENNKKNANNLAIENKKYNQLIEEVRIIQQYCEQNKHHIDKLIGDQTKLIGSERFVDFNDLRSIVKNIEDTLQESLGNLFLNSTNGSNCKALWEYKDDVEFFRERESNRCLRQYLNFQNDKVIIEESGIYHVVCGFFPVAETQMSLILNGIVIFEHGCLEMPKTGVSRTMMLFLSIDAGSEIKLQCSSKGKTSGFISITQF